MQTGTSNTFFAAPEPATIIVLISAPLLTFMTASSDPVKKRESARQKLSEKLDANLAMVHLTRHVT